MAREALIERNTKETQIRLQLNIDGTGSSDIDTGIGFFDHMLDGFTRHGLYDLTLRVHGDLNVDDHHTIEDTGIVLGNAIREANVMAAVFFPWMKFWCSVQWIFPEDLILDGMRSFPRRK
mgnify:CR=1 FL=1